MIKERDKQIKKIEAEIQEEAELRKSIETDRKNKLVFYEYIINDITYILTRKPNASDASLISDAPSVSSSKSSVGSSKMSKNLKKWMQFSHGNKNSYGNNDMTSLNFDSINVFINNSMILIDNIPPMVLAEQISLINYRAFQKIRAREFFGYHTKHPEIHAKNIKKIISEWKGLSAWLQVELNVAV